MAWTIYEDVDEFTVKSNTGVSNVVVVELDCTSDAGASDYDILTDKISGSWFYGMLIVPGTGGDAPAGAFDLDVEDEDDNHILDTNANPAAPTGGQTGHAGSNTLGFMYPVSEKSTVSIVCATLGDGNKVKLKLFFTK